MFSVFMRGQFIGTVQNSSDAHYYVQKMANAQHIVGSVDYYVIDQSGWRCGGGSAYCA